MPHRVGIVKTGPRLLQTVFLRQSTAAIFQAQIPETTDFWDVDNSVVQQMALTAKT